MSGDNGDWLDLFRRLSDYGPQNEATRWYNAPRPLRTHIRRAVLFALESRHIAPLLIGAGVVVGILAGLALALVIIMIGGL